VITVGYMALVELGYTPWHSRWAKQTQWHSINKVPKLAFDHGEILEASIERLKTLLWKNPFGHA
jgi:8-oxo-dGTP diphosphatase